MLGLRLRSATYLSVMIENMHYHQSVSSTINGVKRLFKHLFITVFIVFFFALVNGSQFYNDSGKIFNGKELTTSNYVIVIVSYSIMALLFGSLVFFEFKRSILELFAKKNWSITVTKSRIQYVSADETLSKSISVPLREIKSFIKVKDYDEDGLSCIEWCIQLHDNTEYIFDGEVPLNLDKLYDHLMLHTNIELSTRELWHGKPPKVVHRTKWDDERKI